MKRNFRLAYNELKKIGAPVREGGYNGDDTFRISGEENYDTIWADYYNEFLSADYEFGVNPKITNILNKYGLYCEWCNPGVLDVWEI